MQQLSVVVIVDATVGSAFSQAGLDLYLRKVLELLQAVHQQAKLRALPIIFEGSGSVRHGQASSSVASLLPSIGDLLSRSREKGKQKAAAPAVASEQLLEAMLSGLSTLDRMNEEQEGTLKRHLLLVANSDLPRLPLDFDDGSSALEDLAWSPEVNLAGTWSELAGRFTGTSTAFSLICARYLPHLEALQKQIVKASDSDNVPAQAVPVASPEHAVLMPRPGPLRPGMSTAGSSRGPSSTGNETLEAIQRTRADLEQQPNYAAMSREELIAKGKEQRTNLERLLLAIKAQVQAGKLSEEKAREAAQRFQQRTMPAFAQIEQHLRRLGAEAEIPNIVPGAAASTSAASSVPAAAVAPARPVMLNGPLWKGQLTHAVKSTSGAAPKQEFTLHAQLTVVSKATEEVAFKLPDKLEMSAMLPLELGALHQFTRDNGLMVLKLEPLPAMILDAHRAGEKLAPRNEASFQQLAGTLDAQKYGAFIRLPSLSGTSAAGDHGLLIIAIPPTTPGGPKGTLVISFLRTALPQHIVRRTQPPQPQAPAIPTMSQYARPQSSFEPGPAGSSQSAFEALQNMLNANKRL